MIAQIAVAAIAILGIAGFAFLYAKAIYRVWRHGSEKPSHDTSYVYVATILAGLVGGVAAMMFNEKLPTAPTGGGTTPAASVSREALPGAATDSGPTGVRPGAVELPKKYIVRRQFGPRAGSTAFVRSISVFTQENLLTAMSAVYVFVYLLVGVAAIGTWVLVGDTYTSDLVKNIALISIGLFVAVLRTFFNVGSG